MKSDGFLLDQLMQLSHGMLGAAGHKRGTSSGVSYAQAARADSDGPINVPYEIRKRRDKGESFHEIAVALNRLGACGPYGGRWYASSVRVVAKSWPCGGVNNFV